MPNLSIKDVPDEWAESLRQRAARNHRSLQGELMFLLQQAVRAGEPGGQGIVPSPVAGSQAIACQGEGTFDQWLAAHRSNGQRPVGAQSSSTRIIRASRDRPA